MSSSGASTSIISLSASSSLPSSRDNLTNGVSSRRRIGEHDADVCEFAPAASIGASPDAVQPFERGRATRARRGRRRRCPRHRRSTRGRRARRRRVGPFERSREGPADVGVGADQRPGRAAANRAPPRLPPRAAACGARPGGGRRCRSLRPSCALRPPRHRAADRIDRGANQSDDLARPALRTVRLAVPSSNTTGIGAILPLSGSRAAAASASLSFSPTSSITGGGRLRRAMRAALSGSTGLREASLTDGSPESWSHSSWHSLSICMRQPPSPTTATIRTLGSVAMPCPPVNKPRS